MTAMLLTSFCRIMPLTLTFQLTIQNIVYDSHGMEAIGSVSPTTSCAQFNNMKRVLQCFYSCLVNRKSAYMFSHNSVDKRCMCCNEPPGSNINGTGWRTYIPLRCPAGFTTYKYTFFEICLVYVPEDEKYKNAVRQCKRHGGDLIRIDSLEKYNIFKEYLGQYTGNGSIQVWVQGEKRNDQWTFHDGTPMPGYCLGSQSNRDGEISMRARSVANFRCQDCSPFKRFHYVCEIYRLFSKFH